MFYLRLSTTYQTVMTGLLCLGLNVRSLIIGACLTSSTLIGTVARGEQLSLTSHREPTILGRVKDQIGSGLTRLRL
jgi:hypothetical protein